MARTRQTPPEPGQQPGATGDEPVNTESSPPEGWVQDAEGRWAPPDSDAEPTGESAGEPDPEWTALLDRARAGGDDAAGAVVDAYQRGVLVGVDRAAKELGAPTLTTDLTTDLTIDGITKADTAGLRGVVTRGTPAPQPRRIVVSEQVWLDLQRLGKVTDPGTGYELRLDREAGRVTAHRRGNAERLNIPVVAPIERLGTPPATPPAHH